MELTEGDFRALKSLDWVYFKKNKAPDYTLSTRTALCVESENPKNLAESWTIQTVNGPYTLPLFDFTIIRNVITSPKKIDVEWVNSLLGFSETDAQLEKDLMDKFPDESERHAEMDSIKEGTRKSFIALKELADFARSEDRYDERPMGEITESDITALRLLKLMYSEKDIVSGHTPATTTALCTFSHDPTTREKICIIKPHGSTGEFKLGSFYFTCLTHYIINGIEKYSAKDITSLLGFDLSEAQIKKFESTEITDQSELSVEAAKTVHHYRENFIALKALADFARSQTGSSAE